MLVSSQDALRQWVYIQQQTISAEGFSGTAFSPYFPHTVRSALKGFAARGTAAFYPDAPGPDPDHDRRATVAGLRVVPMSTPSISTDVPRT